MYYLSKRKCVTLYFTSITSLIQMLIGDYFREVKINEILYFKCYSLMARFLTREIFRWFVVNHPIYLYIYLIGDNINY